ncbi:MAG: CDP-glycerol glycerophosphotransferase family protein [Eubacterium sp.]|nr:CDP-glycerol glycerophosphotransferase family protein [Eubacterium sp.]
MKSVKTIVTGISVKTTVLRKVIRKASYQYRYWRYKLRGAGKSVDEKKVVFSSFTGRKYADSPRAIYEYMVNSDEYKDYKFVWVFTQPQNYDFLTKNRNTTVVKQASKECEVAFATAKYWVLNHRVSMHRAPTDKQVFIQTWHGTPLKRLGNDIEISDNDAFTRRELVDIYVTDAKKYTYFLSPSAFASEKFISAFQLKSLGKEDIIVEEGYPRNDFLMNYTAADVARIKAELGIPEGKKVILYAPTWRDNQFNTDIGGYTYKTEVDFDRLQKELGSEYVILFRAHYFVSNAFDFAKYEGFVYNVSTLDDINELYVVSDMLITDYSSVFFDYALIKRPILFFMYDFEMYKNEMRGFYIDIDELPGPIVKTEDELLEQIGNLSKDFTYDEKYRNFNGKFNYLDDGHASERVVHRLIK